MMITKNFLKMACVLSMMIFFISCSDESKNARVEIRLTDAPGDYEAVNLDIDSVYINADANAKQKGWIAMPVKGGTYDLLKLTNGLDTLVGTFEIPAGQISQIRLKLGDGSTLQAGGQTYDLDVPSGQQSGLKIQVHQQIQEGITYKFLLDFDVAKSIVLTGAGQYKLKPVIRAITEAQSGAIKGQISPAEASPAVYAIAGQDTVASAFCDEQGVFLLRGIPAGTYTVSFEPKEGFLGMQEDNIEIEIGSVTQMGTLEIDHQ
jgi:hypothetical protein